MEKSSQAIKLAVIGLVLLAGCQSNPKTNTERESVIEALESYQKEHPDAPSQLQNSPPRTSFPELRRFLLGLGATEIKCPGEDIGFYFDESTEQKATDILAGITSKCVQMKLNMAICWVASIEDPMAISLPKESRKVWQRGMFVRCCDWGHGWHAPGRGDVIIRAIPADMSRSSR